MSWVRFPSPAPFILPHTRRIELDEREVVGGELGAARCNPAAVLDLLKGPLDQISGSIELSFVVRDPSRTSTTLTKARRLLTEARQSDIVPALGRQLTMQIHPLKRRDLIAMAAAWALTSPVTAQTAPKRVGILMSTADTDRRELWLRVNEFTP